MEKLSIDYDDKDFQQPTNSELFEQKNTGRTRKVITSFLFIVIALVIIICVIDYIDDLNVEASHPLTRQELIERQFSSWDGSNLYLTEYIKANMHNPDSFQHVKTTYNDEHKNYLLVKTVFRGTNVYNAVVTNYVIAKIDLNGRILSIIKEGP